MIRHRQIDLDQLPTGDFAAKDKTAALDSRGCARVFLTKPLQAAGCLFARR